MTTLGENLKSARKKMGLSQEVVAKLLRTKYNLKIDRVMISKWETGFQVPNIFSVKCLAEIYNTTMDELNSGINTPPTVIAADTISSHPQTIGTTPIHEDTQEKAIIKLPILGEVAAGYGVYADVTNPIIGYMDIPQAWVRTIPHEEYCVLKVSGDSMEPEIHEGDYALIRCQPLIDNGQIGVVLIDGENGVIKKIKKYDNSIVLVSLNSQYEPRVFAKEEMNRIRFFGIVKKIIREYN